MSSPLQQLRDLGQSVWLDSVRRSDLRPGGELSRLVAAGELDGAVVAAGPLGSALADDAYAGQLAELTGAPPRDSLWRLMATDATAASDVLLPLHRRSHGERGHVSVELDPADAADTEETVSAALLRFRELDRPNVMVRLAATDAGLAALTRLTAEGVHVDATGLFDAGRYEAAADAYVAGLRRRAEVGEDLRVTGVASLHVGSVDARVEAALGDDAPRLATAGVACARAAYETFQTRFSGPDVAQLLAAGARLQRLAWASTSPGAAAHRDVLYLEELAGPDTVTVVSRGALAAFRDQAAVEDRLSGAGGEAQQQLQRLAEQGVDVAQVATDLLAEHVASRAAAFEAAVAAVAERVS
ncbi:transaldolase [soil metagenome]